MISSLLTHTAVRFMIPQGFATMRCTSRWLVSALLVAIATALPTQIAISENSQEDKPAAQSIEPI